MGECRWAIRALVPVGGGGIHARQWQGSRRDGRVLEIGSVYDSREESGGWLDLGEKESDAGGRKGANKISARRTIS